VGTVENLAGMNNSQKGKIGETMALAWLQKHGYAILFTNWRSRHLEIDVIATKGDEIVFVEVKTRYSQNWGAPWEAVNAKKRRLILSAADVFMRSGYCSLEPRFDILSILVSGGEADVVHIPNAFYPERN